MLKENLKNLRKSKGLSQEELSIKLNVVRQTISKWEKGLSVPDSEMLIKIAEELDTSVNVLLGETVVPDETPELKAIAAKLELLNEQLAKKNENRRKVWRVVFIIVGVFAIGLLLLELANYIYFRSVMDGTNAGTSVIGGYDGPINIYISNISFKVGAFITTIVAAIVSVVGLYITRRK